MKTPKETTTNEIDTNHLKIDEKKILGEGSFGTIYGGTYFKMPVAIKTLKGGSLEVIDDFKHEVQTLLYL